MGKPSILRRRSAPVITQLWDWVDYRQIDTHFVALVTLLFSFSELRWAMEFAATSTRPGLEVAAILGAINAPMMLFQSAVVNFYFKARNLPSAPATDKLA